MLNEDSFYRNITDDEAFFLLNTSVWNKTEFDEWLSVVKADSYSAGYIDGKKDTSV